MTIKLSSERICDSCGLSVPYPFLHHCDPSKKEENELERLATKNDCKQCGENDEFVPCFCCGELIKHKPNSGSISHTCFNCNVALGKGE